MGGTKCGKSPSEVRTRIISPDSALPPLFPLWAKKPPTTREFPADIDFFFWKKKISRLLSHAVQNQIPLFISSAAASSTERLEDDSSRSLFGNQETEYDNGISKSPVHYCYYKNAASGTHTTFPPIFFPLLQFSAHFPQPAFSHSCYVEVLSRHHRKRERRVKSTRMEWSPNLLCSSAADPSFPPFSISIYVGAAQRGFPSLSAKEISAIFFEKNLFFLEWKSRKASDAVFQVPSLENIYSAFV